MSEILYHEQIKIFAVDHKDLEEVYKYKYPDNKVPNNICIILNRCIRGLTNKESLLNLSKIYPTVGFLYKLYFKDLEGSHMYCMTYENGEQTSHEINNKNTMHSITKLDLVLKYKYLEEYSGLTEDEIILKLLEKTYKLQLEKEEITKKLNSIGVNINLIKEDVVSLCGHDNVIEEGIWDGHKIIKYYTCQVCKSSLNYSDLPNNCNKKRKY